MEEEKEKVYIIDGEEFEDIGEYEEYEEIDDEVLESEDDEDVEVDCDVEISIRKINEAIEKFNEVERDSGIIINPRVLAHLINVEEDKSNFAIATKLMKELSDLSKVGVVNLRKYKKDIKKEIEIARNERIVKEDPDSSLRFYTPNQSGKMEFRVGLVGEEILEEENFLVEDNLIYIYLDGFYQRRALSRIDFLIKEKLGVNDYTKNRHDSIRSYVLSDINQTYYYEDVMKDEKQTLLLQKYLNLESGLLDIEEDKLYKHTPKIFFKNQIPVNYNPSFKNTINTIFASNFLKEVLAEDTIKVIEEFMGYGMTPNTEKAKALMLTGRGSNGKSVFMEFYRNLIGEKSTSAVALKDFDGDKFKLANLKDKLVNIGMDISSKRLDETEIFKGMIAGDTMSGEFKGIQSFNFKPYAKHIFSANELPETGDASAGFFRRWMICPFNVSFEGREDPHIFNKIQNKDNLLGLFMISLNGLRRLRKNGDFSHSYTMEKMLEMYKEDNKPVKRFMTEIFTVLEDYDKSEDYVLLSDLYEEYREWCEKMGLRSKKYTNFFKDLYNDFPELKKRVKQKRVDGGRHRAMEGVILGDVVESDEENEIVEDKVVNLFK